MVDLLTSTASATLRTDNPRASKPAACSCRSLRFIRLGHVRTVSCFLTDFVRLYCTANLAPGQTGWALAMTRTATGFVRIGERSRRWLASLATNARFRYWRQVNSRPSHFFGFTKGFEPLTVGALPISVFCAVKSEPALSFVGGEMREGLPGH